MKTDPQEEVTQAFYHADNIIRETLPDPVLTRQTVSEVAREALGRLGLPKPPRPPLL